MRVVCGEDKRLDIDTFECTPSGVLIIAADSRLTAVDPVTGRFNPRLTDNQELPDRCDFSPCFAYFQRPRQIVVNQSGTRAYIVDGNRDATVREFILPEDELLLVPTPAKGRIPPDDTDD